jgi:hypothetical protein
LPNCTPLLPLLLLLLALTEAARKRRYASDD